MPGQAAAAARARTKSGAANLPAYTPPTTPAVITHDPIAKGEAVALSPVHALGTVKES